MKWFDRLFCIDGSLGRFVSRLYAVMLVGVMLWCFMAQLAVGLGWMSLR